MRHTILEKIKLKKIASGWLVNEKKHGLHDFKWRKANYVFGIQHGKESYRDGTFWFNKFDKIHGHDKYEGLKTHVNDTKFEISYNKKDDSKKN